MDRRGGGADRLARLPFIVGVNTAPAGLLPFDPAGMGRPRDPVPIAIGSPAPTARTRTWWRRSPDGGARRDRARRRHLERGTVWATARSFAIRLAPRPA